MKENNFFLNVKKIAIAFFIAVLVYVFLYFLHFFQNEQDKNFESRLIASIKPMGISMFSDIETSGWKEVCILPPYKKPYFYGGRSMYSSQLYRKGMALSIPIILDKFNENVWWIFFADESKKIVSLYRMSRSASPYPYGNKESEDIVNYVSDNYVPVSGDFLCSVRDNAAIVGHTYGKNNFIFLNRK